MIVVAAANGALGNRVLVQVLLRQHGEPGEGFHAPRASKIVEDGARSFNGCLGFSW